MFALRDKAVNYIPLGYEMTFCTLSCCSRSRSSKIYTINLHATESSLGLSCQVPASSEEAQGRRL